MFKLAFVKDLHWANAKVGISLVLCSTVLHLEQWQFNSALLTEKQTHVIKHVSGYLINHHH